MTIIVFLLDTSASMNQRVFLGGRPTLLDVAKSAVETFVKVRQRSIDSRQDRYMLLTFEEPPANIKAGWKENLATFMSELKNLQANGLTTLGHALRHTFDVLNVNRMQHGIDTYGQGRCPFYLEPSIIVAITDGGKLSSNSGVQEELKMHGSSPGCELTREPFRWDQRLFSLVLRMSGQPAGDRDAGHVPSDHSPIDAMCEVTGGRSYCITTHRMLHQCIDSLVQKVQAGVVIHFEKVGLDPPPLINNLEAKDDEETLEEKNERQAWQNCRKMIYVPRSNQKGFAGGFWPIPEAFWPDPSMPTLPPRAAHPHVKFTCVAQEPLVVENFPFDKYELEPSPLTQFILARKQPTICWQAYMSNSSKNGQLSQPFGYLKASTNLTCVNLFVMPHNYPVLLPLLDDLFRVYRLKPSNEWKAQFGMYLSQMPGYYAGPLKRALIRMGAGNIAQTIPEDTYLSYSVLNYLKKLKTQAKIEYEKTCNEVGARVKLSETKRIVTSYKNPFDVPRHQLLEHLAKLRTHFLRPTPFSDLQQDNIHSMPVGQMGNYQEYLKRQPTPLREIESAPVRQHMFGNPFKIDKRMIIDEADIDFLGQNGRSAKKEAQLQQQQQQLQQQQQMSSPGHMSPGQIPLVHRGLKRKRGPLPPDYFFTPKKSRPSSPSTSPVASPSSSPLRPPSSPLSIDLDESDEPSSPPPLPSPAWVDENEFGKRPPDEPTKKSPILPTEPSPPPAAPPAVEDTKPYRANSFLSDSMTLAMWTDEDFQERDGDDDKEEELPDVGNDDDDDEELGLTIVEASSPPPIPSTSSSSNSNTMAAEPEQELKHVPAEVVKNGPIAPISPMATVNGELKHEVLAGSGGGGTVSPSSIRTNGVRDDAPVPKIATKANSSNLKGGKKRVTGSGSTGNSSNSSSSGSKTKSKSTRVIKKEAAAVEEEEKVPGITSTIDEEAIRQQNLELRAELFREIRRPIFRMDLFLTKLTEISGSQEIKIQFLKNLEKEAVRFKRKRVAEMLARQLIG